MENDRDQRKDVRVVTLDPDQINKRRLEHKFRVALRGSQIAAFLAVALLGVVVYWVRWSIDTEAALAAVITTQLGTLHNVLSMGLVFSLILTIILINNYVIVRAISKTIGRALLASDVRSTKNTGEDPEQPQVQEEEEEEEETKKDR